MANLLKIEIDLDDVWGYNDDGMGHILKEVIKDEIKRTVKSIVKAALKEQEKQLKATVQKAVKRDWKKVADIIQQLDQDT